MVLLSQSKRPKFLLTLDIQELSNIPKVSGACYVKWYIKDSPTQQIKGRTSKVAIKDHRAHWDYSFETLLKIGMSRAKFLQEKTLVLTVYVHNTHHHHHHHHHSQGQEQNKGHQRHLSVETRQSHSPNLPQSDIFDHLDEKLIPKGTQKTILGKVEINLPEYLNYEEPTSNRYLLQESKVNCILNVKIGLEPLKGARSEFIAPSLKNTNVFKGISDVFGEGSTHDSTTGHSSPQGSHHRANSASGMSSNEKYHKSSMAITSDPVVSKLYEKTFEISWDPRPGEFNAVDSIDDIFNGGDGWAKNEDGVNLIDLDIKSNQTNNSLFQVNDANGDGSTKTLLKECDIREDMKSWVVNQIRP